MGDSGAIRAVGAGLRRRDLLRLGAAATVAALVPATAAAAPPPDKKPGGSPPPTSTFNPYTGHIPLVFPLPVDSYVNPVVDNWHDNRDGNYGYTWSHQNSPARRAHDGIDIFPQDSTKLPTVYAPFSARVAAVHIVGKGYTTNPDTSIAPPWNGYSEYPNIYGNYSWLYSTDAGDGIRAGSLGFFVFYCHLQADDPLLQLMADKATNGGSVTAIDAVGTMGETGNAAGQPQLHVEIHLPQGLLQGSTFTCTRCTRNKSGLTAVNPFPSLSNAKAR